MKSLSGHLVFTQKKRVTVLELMKNQSSEAFEKQIRCKVVETIDFKSGPEKDLAASKLERRQTYSLTHQDVSSNTVKMVNWLS